MRGEEEEKRRMRRREKREEEVEARRGWSRRRRSRGRGGGWGVQESTPAIPASHPALTPAAEQVPFPPAAPQVDPPPRPRRTCPRLCARTSTGPAAAVSLLCGRRLRLRYRRSVDRLGPDQHAVVLIEVLAEDMEATNLLVVRERKRGRRRNGVVEAEKRAGRA